MDLHLNAFEVGARPHALNEIGFFLFLEKISYYIKVFIINYTFNRTRLSVVTKMTIAHDGWNTPW